MSVTEVKLKRLDDPESEEVLLEGGESFLGRGPLLQIDATNISRKHARLNIVSSEVLLTSTHRNNIFVKTAGAWQELQQGKTVSLKPLDEIKFLEDKFHFRVSFTEGGGSSVDSSPPPPPPHSVVITPKPTGLKVEKKRKLPSWLEESASPPKKKIATKEKSPTSREIYDSNVKLVNSSLTAERNKDDGDGSDADLDRPGPSTPFSISPEKRRPKSFPKLVDEERSNGDLAGPGPSKPIPISPQKQKTKEKENDREADKENRKVLGENSKTLRPACPYGGGCYRKNPVHRQEESHPGDDDYQDPAPVPPDQEEEGKDDEDKPECEYGLDCYRKNPQHRKDYKHTRHPQPKRAVKVKNAKKKKKTEDDYDSDDSFIDDEEDGWEPVDDSDEDVDYKAPANMSSELDYDDPADSSDLE